MKMSLTIHAETDAEVAKLQTIIGAVADMPSLLKTPKAKATTPAAEAKIAGETERETAAEEKSTKLGRPKKAVEAPKVTIKDVRRAFAELIDSLGEDDGPVEGKKLLKKFGAKQIPEVAEEHYADLIAEVRAVIESKGETADVDASAGDDDLGLDDDE